jgi:hypothetical protein
MTKHCGWPGSVIKILARTFLVAAGIFSVAFCSIGPIRTKQSGSIVISRGSLVVFVTSSKDRIERSICSPAIAMAAAPGAG